MSCLFATFWREKNSMDLPTPFAYGSVGGVLVTTDDRFVCVTPDGDDGPTWSYEAAARVAGVRNTRAGIVVVDANGRLAILERDNGKILDQLDLAVVPITHSATE